MFWKEVERKYWVKFPQTGEPIINKEQCAVNLAEDLDVSDFESHKLGAAVCTACRKKHAAGLIETPILSWCLDFDKKNLNKM